MTIITHYQWKCFSIEEQPHLLPDGREIAFTTLIHPGAVIIIPIDSDGNLVMVHQYRPAVKQWLLEFPAGTIEPNEDILISAQRELAEETNLAAKQWHALGELLPVPGFCDEIQYLYVVKELTPTQGELDDDEIMDVVTFSVAEIEQKIIDNQIQDNKTLAAFLKARLLGFI
ncbi:ADP-ribose pyrophosphatase [Photobacterium aquimaris]|uniref:GDP-mannose pyrophosphatase n=2 Tax=Photobacterium TaxID=657 RepID=A0A2T3INY6_9GAMM|nr:MULTISPECIES: NUDIX hydrolase [Photobacterium]OBU16217.1 ADP-ribose pyrophosphatase [Photobacterium aquimaris]OBU19860.1 ADP-ribose pyrophosphatase [Photobacterium aquimaris]PSU30054.1 NUDIX hydrolase [Photobacterium aquimaris]PSW02381.1 NUDIX hydrolase [Photobacterium aquimaris]SMY33922.1 ADP-ribose pyrophosphatase [Photobacterium malacitanum]